MRNLDGRVGVRPAFLATSPAGDSRGPGPESGDDAWPNRSLRIPCPRRPLAGGRARALGRLASLALVLEVALALRVAAADAVEWFVRRGGPARLDLFPDTDIYWELARAIRAGGPYEYVEWGDIPHFAIRTPGYPLLLAACQAVFGERTLPVRLVQAALGTLCVYLVYRLARQLVLPPVRDSPTPAPASSARPGGDPAAGPSPWSPPRWRPSTRITC